MDILLLSGGADSMYLKSKFNYDKFVYFCYGQSHIDKELEVLGKDKKLQIIRADNVGDKDEEGFYKGRNLNFILSVMYMYPDTKSISIGTNAEDIYPDNCREFFDLVEKIIYASYKTKVKIKTPLIKKSKKEIVKFLDLNNIGYYTDK